LVKRAQGKVPGHEFNDGPQADHRCTDAHTGKPSFGNRSVHYSALAETVKQSFRDFVGTIVVADFLPHEKHALVALHFFGHSFAQGFTIG
jgi:hypothetical protein